MDLLLFFSLLWDKPLPDTKSTKMLESLLFLSGPSKKIQSQFTFLMKIQNRHLLYPNWFSLKKLQWSMVRGKAICQSLKSVNNAKQTALCSIHLCFQVCSPSLCTHPGFTWRFWWPASQMMIKERWVGWWFLTSVNLEDCFGGFFSKRPRNDWHCWHPILSTGVTPSGKTNKARPFCSGLVCSAKGFFMSPLLSESTSTFQYCNKRHDEPLFILFISLSLSLALSLFTLCHWLPLHVISGLCQIKIVRTWVLNAPSARARYRWPQ